MAALIINDYEIF